MYPERYVDRFSKNCRSVPVGSGDVSRSKSSVVNAFRVSRATRSAIAARSRATTGAIFSHDISSPSMRIFAR
jgi:hypothetical protein